MFKLAYQTGPISSQVSKLWIRSIITSKREGLKKKFSTLDFLLDSSLFFSFKIYVCICFLMLFIYLLIFMNKVFLVSFKLPTDYMGNVLQVWVDTIVKYEDLKKIKGINDYVNSTNWFFYLSTSRKKEKLGSLFSLTFSCTFFSFGQYFFFSISILTCFPNLFQGVRGRRLIWKSNINSSLEVCKYAACILDIICHTASITIKCLIFSFSFLNVLKQLCYLP